MGHSERSMGRQEAFYCAPGNFARVHPVRWYEGVDLFHRLVLQLLYKLLEGYMVRVLNGKFFVQEANSVCSSIVPPLNRTEHLGFLCLLYVIRVVIWTTQQKEFHKGDLFLSQPLVAFYKHKIKIKILTKTLFFKIWQKVGECCALVSRDLKFFLEIIS